MLTVIKKSEKGQALVELALILPILLLLVFGIIEFGRIFGTHLMITHGAREGARAASVGATDSEITLIIKSRTAAFVADPNELKINITPSEGYRSRGDGERVEVQYPVKIYTPVISGLISNPYVTSTEVIMRVE